MLSCERPLTWTNAKEELSGQSFLRVLCVCFAGSLSILNATVNLGHLRKDGVDQCILRIASVSEFSCIPRMLDWFRV